MKVSFNLKKECNKNGEQPLYLTISHLGNRKYIRLGELKKKNWDSLKCEIIGKGTKLNNLSDKLDDFKIKIKKILRKHEEENTLITATSMKNLLLDEKKEDFIEYATDWIAIRKNKGELTYRTTVKYKSILKKLKDFTKTQSGKEKLPIKNFNKKFINAFKHHMDKELENTTNTITSNLKFLKTYCTHLEDIELLKRNDNPFNGMKMKHTKPKRKALTMSQILSIENLEIQNQSVSNSRRLFLFLYESGLRINEALQIRITDVYDEHLLHKLSKRKEGERNDKVKLYLSSKAKMMVDNLLKEAAQDQIFLFNYLDEKSHNSESKLLSDISSYTAIINKDLKVIAKCINIETLSTHIGRHSLATIALTHGQSLEDIQSLLNHRTRKTTEQYAHITNLKKQSATKRLDEIKHSVIME